MYNEDEDIELLQLLAMIADINNDKVIRETVDNKLLDDIRNEVAVFSQNKEVQAMLLEEKMAILDWNTNRAAARAEGRAEGREEGRAEGRAEGREEVQKVYAWLYDAGRADDVKKAIDDSDFFEKVYQEYLNK